jgi:hypothetical protein
MKRTIIFSAVGIFLIIVSFAVGRFYQDAKNGYHCKMYEQKHYECLLGTIQWSCVGESVGMPFLDPETTLIQFNNRVIYKAQRDFQEDAPYARNIVVTNDSIAWDDGDFQYHLTISTNVPKEKNRRLR